MRHKFVIAGIAALLLTLMSGYALADDPLKPAETPAVATEKPADAVVAKDEVSDAETIIDEAVKEIDKDPGKQISLLVELAKSGRWGPFAGLLILFIVWAIRKFLLKLIKPNVLPWLTLGLAMVASVGVGLGFGNVWWQVLIDGLITGGAAGLMWSALFKHLLGEKKKT